MTWGALWAWLVWSANDEPVEFAAVAAVVLGLPVLAAWMVWLDRRTR